jgi:hypothetical protein
MNRVALDKIDVATADAMFEMGKAIVGGAAVPDAPPLTVGLLEGGGVVAYVKGPTGNARKVAEWMRPGRGHLPVKKPSAARNTADTVNVWAGFGFPGRMVETGTANMAAEPFLTPSLMQRIPEAAGFVSLAYAKAKLISAARASVGDTFVRSRAGKVSTKTARASSRYQRRIRNIQPAARRSR